MEEDGKGEEEIKKKREKGRRKMRGRWKGWRRNKNGLKRRSEEIGKEEFGMSTTGL